MAQRYDDRNLFFNKEPLYDEVFEERNVDGKIIVKERKWFNYVRRDTFHRIKCDDYAWSIQAGFTRDEKVKVKINNKIYPHRRLFTMGGRSDGTLG